MYIEKLAGLRGDGDKIETRYVEAGVRKPAAEKLRGTANAYLAAATSTDMKYAHIEAADKQKARIFAANTRFAIICPRLLAAAAPVFHEAAETIIMHYALTFDWR